MEIQPLMQVICDINFDFYVYLKLSGSSGESPASTGEVWTRPKKFFYVHGETKKNFLCSCQGAKNFFWSCRSLQKFFFALCQLIKNKNLPYKRPTAPFEGSHGEPSMGNIRPILRPLEIRPYCKSLALSP